MAFANCFHVHTLKISLAITVQSTEAKEGNNLQDGIGLLSLPPFEKSLN